MDFKLLIKIAGSMLIIMLLVYFGFSYFTSQSSKEIPTIEADKEPTKIKPTDAGGIILPHSDSVIYENMGKSGATKKIAILPEPEQALPMAGLNNIDAELENSIDSMLASVIQPSSTNDHSPEDDQVIDSIFEEIPANFSTDEPLNPEASPSSATGVKSLNIVKIAENENKHTSSVKSPVRSQKTIYKIQLASMKSESSAIIEGERLKHKYLKVLGNSVISHKKVQQDSGKFFYIILAGDYLTLSKAKAACKKLSARQQSCMIYQP